MEPFRRLVATAAPLPRRDVDTDQIIPARYLKVTGREGLAAGLFAAWREDPEFVLNRPERRDARILLAGDNFGCGSSREHAAWALLDHGFRAVLAPGFGDIFRNNALKNGLLAAELPAGAWSRLVATAEADPASEIVVDLETSTVTGPDGEAVRFTVEPFARHCLLQGLDPFGYLLEQLPAIRAWQDERPVPVDTTAP